MARYRLLLISPLQKCKHFAVQPEMNQIIGRKATSSSLALTLLAAVTPAHYDIRILDEELEPLPSDLQADIVGITALSSSIKRSYEIADSFRRRGIKVVLGGPHTSFAADEAMEHADALVAGEAEGVWPRVLADFEAGTMAGVYRATEPVPFKTSPQPRWDLVDTRKVLCIPVEVSRGCPFDCEFCVVTKLFGRKMRYRDIDDVVRELSNIPLRTVLFVDDNLTVNRRYAMELMERITPLNITWTCQASIDVGMDAELLAAMARAGCEHIIIGFESLNPASLENARKFHNRIEEYQKALDAIHAAGIITFGSFIVGFDHDTIAEFDRILEFVQKAPVTHAMLCVLVPGPGTDLRARLTAEGRFFKPNSDFMGGMFPAMKYARLGQTEIANGYQSAVEKLYSFKAMRERANRLLRRGSFRSPRRGNELKAYEKFTIFFKVLAIYLLSADRDKRGMLFDMLGLAIRGTASIDRAIGMLISMEGFHRHVRELHRYRRDFEPVLAFHEQNYSHH